MLQDARAVDAKHAAGKDVKPLCGFAFAVKDNIDVAGYPTTAGTPALEGKAPTKSAPFIVALQKANGVVGLTVCHVHETQWQCASWQWHHDVTGCMRML